MFLQGRVTIVWVTWALGGACGVLVLLLAVCYCRLMPRHHKSFDEQYLKESHSTKEHHAYCNQESYGRSKHVEVQTGRAARGVLARPNSYAGEPPPPPPRARPSPHAQHAQHARTAAAAAAQHHASSGMLEEAAGSAEAEAEAEAEGGEAAESLKTRSLPAFLRPRARPRPLSDADADGAARARHRADLDLHPLYAKVSLSKKYKNRMRSEHAAIIALSKSRSQFLDADAVIVYDQRTQL